jgi:hypothetical protein
MVGRDEAVVIALKLTADDPPSVYQEVERVGDVFTRDGGLTWTVHLVLEPLNLGEGTIAVDTPGTWAVYISGTTGRAKWIGLL